jgi:uncharacterized protein
MQKDLRDIIYALYKDNTRAMDVLLAHSEAVARKAIEIAHSVPHLGADLKFIEEAALLHDIGMIRTDAPMLGCHGDLHYICHGVEGRLILEAHGLNAHALVCERHVGVGLTVKDIREKRLPIPEYDMLPLSVEEKIVCFSDKFFSKLGETREKSIGEVRTSIARYGEDKAREFDSMLSLFSPVP